MQKKGKWLWRFKCKIIIVMIMNCYAINTLAHTQREWSDPWFCFQMHTKPYCMQINLLHFILFSHFAEWSRERRDRGGILLKVERWESHCCKYSSRTCELQQKQTTMEVESKWKNHFPSRDNKLEALSSFVAGLESVTFLCAKSMFCRPFNGFLCSSRNKNGMQYHISPQQTLFRSKARRLVFVTFAN